MAFTKIIRFRLINIKFYLFRNGMPKIQDLFPPSRITDLRIKNYVDDSLEVVLTWTAPGGDFNVGSAERYRITGYANRTAATTKDGGYTDDAGIPVHESEIPRPRPSGTAQECRVTLPWPNQILYFSVVAVDDAGNVGPASNLVPAFVRRLVTLPPVDLLAGTRNNTSAALPSSVLDAFEDNLLVYIVAGCVTGIVLIVIIVILVSLRNVVKNHIL